MRRRRIATKNSREGVGADLDSGHSAEAPQLLIAHSHWSVVTSKLSHTRRSYDYDILQTLG